MDGGGIPAASPDVWPSEYYGDYHSTSSLLVFLFVAFLIILSLVVCYCDEQKVRYRRQPQRRLRAVAPILSQQEQLRQLHLSAAVVADATRQQPQQHQRQSYPVNSQRPPRLSPDQEDKRIEEIAMECTECVICLGKYTSDEIGVTRRTLKPCGHRFHTECIDEWLKKGHSCPICRGVSRDSSVSVRGYSCPV